MKNSLFLLLNALGLTASLRYFKNGKLTVLSLHRICFADDYFFQPIRPELFEELLKYVSKYYRVISFTQLSQGDFEGDKPFLILSFDDGYYDFIQYAMPLLDKYKLPCNHNLVNACLNENAIIWTQQLNDCFKYFRKNAVTQNEALATLGFTLAGNNNNWWAYYMSVFRYLLTQKFDVKTELLNNIRQKYCIECNYRMMNWADAKQALAAGVEIGSHSYHHDSLNTITEESDLNREIRNSKTELEEKLQTTINILAPPNGQFNKEVSNYCQISGIKYFLLVDDNVTPVSELNGNFASVARIGLINEGKGEMLLRTELFHTWLRKWK